MSNQERWSWSEEVEMPEDDVQEIPEEEEQEN
jgi:hypothetical protein